MKIVRPNGFTTGQFVDVNVIKETEMKIKIKCVGCGNRREVGEEQTEMPMCKKCFSPMIAESAEYE